MYSLPAKDAVKCFEETFKLLDLPPGASATNLDYLVRHRKEQAERNRAAMEKIKQMATAKDSMQVEKETSALLVAEATKRREALRRKQEEKDRADRMANEKEQEDAIMTLLDEDPTTAAAMRIQSLDADEYERQAFAERERQMELQLGIQQQQQLASARVPAPASSSKPELTNFMKPNDGIRYTGIVRMFSSERRYGFIMPKGVASQTLIDNPSDEVKNINEQLMRLSQRGAASDVYLHGDDVDDVNKLQVKGLTALCVGETVEFSVVSNADKASMRRQLRAVHVTGPEGQGVRVQLEKNRNRGIVRHWATGKEFGFIRPDDGSPDVFFHGSAVCWAPTVARNSQQVGVGFSVEYTAMEGPNVTGLTEQVGGRLVAVGVTDKGYQPIDPAIITIVEMPTADKESRKRARAPEDEGDQRNRREETLQPLKYDDDIGMTW